MARVSVPAETSKVFPLPTVMSDVAIVVPSILPPLMSTLVAVKFVVVIESALTVPEKVSATIVAALKSANTKDGSLLSIIFDLGEESKAESWYCAKR